MRLSNLSFRALIFVYSYMCATGLPVAQPDHAVRMVMFARECMHRMGRILQELAPRLGSDTKELAMRVGMHR